jgi:hypothetical protein
VKRLQHLELARAGVAVLADIRVEGEQLDLWQVDALFAEKVQREDARLRPRRS